MTRINADDAYRSIYSFVRHSKDNKKNLLFVINFTPVGWDDYRVIVEDIEKKYAGHVKFCGVDIEESPELADDFSSEAVQADP